MRRPKRTSPSTATSPSVPAAERRTGSLSAARTDGGTQPQVAVRSAGPPPYPSSSRAGHRRSRCRLGRVSHAETYSARVRRGTARSGGPKRKNPNCPANECQEGGDLIDLARSQSASPLVHAVATDPGTAWTKDVAVAIEAPILLRKIGFFAKTVKFGLFAPLRLSGPSHSPPIRWSTFPSGEGITSFNPLFRCFPSGQFLNMVACCR